MNRSQKANKRPDNPLPFLVKAGALLWLSVAACTQHRVTPVTWKFDFVCEASARRTEQVKLQVARGGCPIAGSVIFETWTSTWESVASRPQGIPSGQYAFQATALDANGGEVASQCRVIKLPTASVISLDLEEDGSCDDGGVDPQPKDAGAHDGGVDESLPDATPPDASLCNAGPISTWWLDADADGYGDRGPSMQSCTQPLGYAANSEDCDDGDGTRHPGATELCDTVDSDCDANLTDGCSTACSPKTFESRLYWMCNTKTSWGGALLACTTGGMTLVRVDSAAENEFLLETAFPLLDGEAFWLGGTDAAEEGVWSWTSGDTFFRGVGATGMPENSAYTRWKVGEPGNSTLENCTELRSGSYWNDVDCLQLREFVCEQPR